VIRDSQDTLRKHADREPTKDDMLVKAYLTSHRYHLHIRRTLDQFHYIGMEDTSKRDMNQVVQRYAVKGLKSLNNIRKDHIKMILQSKLIMVDQLWLWVIGKSLSPFSSSHKIMGDILIDTDTD
jgi:hypothetical protein